MQRQIYWHTTVHMPDDSVLTPIPEKADVAIIGGGFTGLSAARTLAKNNINVVVLEAETIGWGASSRNGGMTLTGLKPAMQTVLKTYGRELAGELFQCSLDAVNLVERIVKEENIDCGFARRGHILLANKPTHFEALKKDVEFMQKEFNYETKLIAPQELRAEIGSELYFGGLLDEISGGLNPAQYARGLADAAERVGATLCARARVVKLERSKNGFFLQTARGNLSAEKVIVGTSGYTGALVKKLQRRIIPLGSYILATETLTDEVARELIPNERMLFDYKNFLNYFRLWDKRLIFGGRAAFFPENKRTLEQSGRILRDDMTRVYPQLKDAKVEYVWGGVLDFTFDDMAHVGEEEGVFYALGYAGHGVALATYLGATTAEALLKGNIQEHPFAKFAFPSAPLGLYNGFPWFLPFAGAWHKILDWAG